MRQFGPQSAVFSWMGLTATARGEARASKATGNRLVTCFYLYDMTIGNRQSSKSLNSNSLYDEAYQMNETDLVGNVEITRPTFIVSCNIMSSMSCIENISRIKRWYNLGVSTK